MNDDELKQYIADKWNVTSASYDDRYGHRLTRDGVRDEWVAILSEVLGSYEQRILDVGCGTGEITLIMASMGHRVQGLDISEEMLNVARKKAEDRRLDIPFGKGDAEKLPYPDHTFDVVINRHLLWTLPHPEEAMKEWSRVVRPGGRVIVIDGVWKSKTLRQKIARTLGEIMILFIERRNPWRSYDDKARNALPNYEGVSSDRTMEYLKKAGMVDVASLDLSKIQRIQKTDVPRRQKIGYNWDYHLVSGRKEV